MLEALGYDEVFAGALEALRAREGALSPGRVVKSGRRQHQVATEHGEVAAVVPGRSYVHGERSEPVVGDWVALRTRRDRTVIAAVLPRRSAFRRRAAGRATASQVIVANVDIALLLMGLDDDFNPRRLERYLALAHASGARPVVVLNKRDLAADLARSLADVRAIAPGVPVHAISAKHDDGLDALAPYLQPAVTLALLGSSGVGKSTLLNCLLGHDRQRTAEVRRTDGKGKHTTTARELIALASGALLIDTPGMRELGMWDDAEEGLDMAFADISALAAACRFSDCRHASEPGCAVRDAIATGALDPARLTSFRKLHGEADAVAQKRLRQQYRVIQRDARRRKGD